MRLLPSHVQAEELTDLLGLRNVGEHMTHAEQGGLMALQRRPVNAVFDDEAAVIEVPGVMHGRDHADGDGDEPGDAGEWHGMAILADGP
mgnify:CR=1 FL=1